MIIPSKKKKKKNCQVFKFNYKSPVLEKFQSQGPLKME